jgi:hypothetical protein
MADIEVGESGEIVLETTLTQGQVAKFNALARKLIVEDGSAYIPIDELHGVLLTSSRERARTIVNNHKDVVKAYLVRDSVRFQKYNISAAIKPAGLYALLETLAEDNPKKATDYRASLALLSYVVAKNPQLAFSASVKAKHNEVEKNSIVSRLKRAYKVCQLSEEPFIEGDEKHVHHIEGKCEEPALVTTLDNLIVIKGDIHRDYHRWLGEKRLRITRYTLEVYARRHNLSVEALRTQRSEPPMSLWLE